MAPSQRANGVLESAIAIHSTAAPVHVAQRRTSHCASNDSGVGPAYLRGLCRWKGKSEDNDCFSRWQSCALLQRHRRTTQRNPQPNIVIASQIEPVDQNRYALTWSKIQSLSIEVLCSMCRLTLRVTSTCQICLLSDIKVEELSVGEQR
jgi:hypothetical protein